jgi:hypothetical protein
MPESGSLSVADRQWRSVLVLGWPLALGIAPVLVALGDVPLCAFRQLTGRPCPLCGGTRACAALVEGNLAAAWQANPGLLPLLVIAAAHSVQLAHEAWTGRRASAWRVRLPVWIAGGVFLLASWVVRLLTS